MWYRATHGQAGPPLRTWEATGQGAMERQGTTRMLLRQFPSILGFNFCVCVCTHVRVFCFLFFVFFFSSKALLQNLMWIFICVKNRLK